MLDLTCESVDFMGRMFERGVEASDLEQQDQARPKQSELFHDRTTDLSELPFPEEDFNRACYTAPWPAARTPSVAATVYALDKA
jgi:hypothetical protein